MKKITQFFILFLAAAFVSANDKIFDPAYRTSNITRGDDAQIGLSQTMHYATPWIEPKNTKFPLEHCGKIDKTAQSIKNISKANLLVLIQEINSNKIVFFDFVPADKIFTIPQSENALAVYILRDVDGVRFPVYFLSDNSKLDKWDSLELLQNMTKDGASFGDLILGLYHLRGEGGVEGDYEKAYKHLLAASEKENYAAMLVLSQMFRDGVGVEADPEKAFGFANAALAFGCKPALTYLGFYYARGMGVKKDMGLAKIFLSKAAEANDDAALISLSEYYLKVEKNETKAIECLERAAKLGSRIALELLGDFYEKKAKEFAEQKNEAKYKSHLKMAQIHFDIAANRGSKTAQSKISSFKLD